MGDLFFFICIAWAAFWLGGKTIEADLAQECLINNTVKMDTIRFVCVKEIHHEPVE